MSEPAADLEEVEAEEVARRLSGVGWYPWYVVVVLMLALVVAIIDRQLLSLLVDPIKRDLEVTDTQIGLLAGFAFAVFYTVLGVPIARLADRVNRSALISAGILLWSLATAACGLSRSYIELFLARMGVGVGEASLAPSAFSMMSDYFPPDQFARAAGVYQMGHYLGTGLAMLGGSFIVSLTLDVESLVIPIVGAVYSWQLAFLIAAVPGLIVLALLTSVKEPERTDYSSDGTRRVVQARATTWTEFLSFLKARRAFFISLCFGAACVGTVITAYLVWVPEMMRRTYGWGIVDAGYAYGAILVAFGMPGCFAGGWIASSLARRKYADAEMRTTLIGVCGILPFAVLMPLSPNPVVALILLCPLVFFMALPHGLVLVMAQLVTPNAMRGQVTAFFMLMAVLTGYTAGGAFVAMLTDYVFMTPQALHYALAIVGGVFTTLSILSFIFGLRPFARARANSAI